MPLLLFHGTVFRISATGSGYRVLHSFGNVQDGLQPSAVVDVNGTLYGTTLWGGDYNGGTVFSVSTTGSNYRVLHTFVVGTPDGANPAAGLVGVNGMLYGTTSFGGTSGSGTVFRISTEGTNYRVLHSFGGPGDGVSPEVSLVEVNGTLYGTTFSGGRYGTGASSGTAFSVRTDGMKYRVLHSFGGTSDGKQPSPGPLVYVAGRLYGSTACGGANGGGSGCTGGTIFSLTTKGKERIVYSFPATGAYEPTGIAGAQGTLYGITFEGGFGCCSGTVFTVGTNGQGFSVLHNFGKGSDGDQPYANPIYANGTLYGTTNCGGRYGAENCASYNGRGGTVFALAP